MINELPPELRLVMELTPAVDYMSMHPWCMKKKPVINLQNGLLLEVITELEVD